MRRRFARATSAVVVGAGIVGLSTALHLRRDGLRVRVLDREHVAAGASWGNAGWLTTPITTPLPEPAVLRTGLSALVSPDSPLYVPLRPDLDLIRFLVSFGLHCTPWAWRRAMGHYLPLNARALDAFDALADLGVAEPTHRPTAFVAAFGRSGQERGLVEEFAQIRAAGGRVDSRVLTGDEVRALAPAVSGRVETGVLLEGTRYLDPPRYLAALAAACRAAGVVIEEGAEATAVDGGTPHRPARVTTGTRPGAGPEVLEADVVVLATGARLGALARGFGVRRVVQAGRGYSFTVPVDPMPTIPLYFQHVRVACTPLGERYRVAGMMEFRRPGEPLDPRRIAAIVKAAAPLLSGADFDDRVDEWVGSRPCTGDGLPLVGPTRSPRVIAAGGHGMWGVTLGPLTGELIAAYVRDGVVPRIARPLDPLR